MAQPASNDLMTLGLVPLGAIVGACLLAAVLAVFLVSGGANDAHREALANNQADVFAGHIEGRLEQIQGQLSSVASTIRLSQVLSSGDQSLISLEESALTQMVPNAIRVRLFPTGSARVERNTVPPFSFPSLDLVTKAENGEPITPEALEAGGRWLLTVATPVRAPSSTIVNGTLFVYLDMRAISSGMPLEINGRASILQTYAGGTPADILVTGSGAPDGAPDYTRKLSTNIWSVHFRPSAALGSAQVLSTLTGLLPVFVALVIALGGAAFGIIRAVGLIRADADWLSAQVDAFDAGTYKASSAYVLAPFKGLEDHIVRVVANASPHAIDTLDTPPPPPDEDDTPLPPLSAADAKPQPAATGTESSPGLEIEDIDEDEFAEYLDLEDEEPEAAEIEIATADDEPQAMALEEAASEEPEPDFPLDDLDDDSAEAVPVEVAAEEDDLATIFRACDIRGVINETLTEDVIYAIGQAIGTEAEARGEQTILVGADGRVSSPAVSEVLIRGIAETGCDVVNLGTVPTPVLYYATNNSDATSGVMITGGQSPADVNGFKMVLAGDTLVDEDIQRLYERIVNEDFKSGQGDVSEADVLMDYVDAVSDDVVVAQPLRVVVDCGHGVGGLVAEELYNNLGCETILLHGEIDGDFPVRAPEPADATNLAPLIEAVQNEEADLGLALDPDADRLIAITADGDIVWPDQLLMLFAKDVVARNPGSDVVFDVRCTRHLSSVISGVGGRPIVSRCGHGFIKSKLRETDAVLGGEASGHIYFGERWFGFEDGLYAGARLIEVIGSQSEPFADLVSALPFGVVTPEIQVPVSDATKFQLMDRIAALAEFGDGSATSIDGIRVDYPDGFGVVRASNSGPWLTLRFEADDEDTLGEIRVAFHEQLTAIDDSLDF